MNYTIYKQSTGQIVRTVYTDDIVSQLAEGESYIDNSYNDTLYYIANQQPVEIPAKPSPYAEFDYSNKQWVLNPTLAIREVKSIRQQLLVSSDWTDTLSAKNRLGETLYDQWQAYRQALRDITTQSEYPYSVVWPTKPS
jgi:hypothetical protein